MNSNRFSGMLDEYAIHWATSAPAVEVSPRSSADLTPAQRRYLDRRAVVEWVLAAVLLVATTPFMLAAMLLVRLTSTGPALYQQTRLGRDGRPFRILKIRTMTVNCEAATGPQWSLPGDTRITSVGKWLRALHLDELPQLVNVLRGDMALIGPRPERPEIAGELEQTIPDFPCRLAVRPGITGYAQVQLPADTEVARVRHKLALDLQYIRSMNPLMDVQIAFCTALKMFGVPFGFARWLLRQPEEQTTVFENAPRPEPAVAVGRAVRVREAA